MGDSLFRRWQELERVLDEVLDLEPSDRGARLARPDVDPEVKRRVEELLRAEPAAAEFLETPPPVERILREAEPVAAPERVGPYRIVGVLGHGGMGTVLAGVRDEHGFMQRVAIKRLHPASWSGLARERFLREREILAGLEHPNIARLLEGGVDESGMPYFAMEQVEGSPITDHCRRVELDLTARLRLVVQICHAVEFAHGRLVVHRDLKPSNVLVTTAGHVKLLDFGIAKLLEDTPEAPTLTATHARMMTPAYAAPEQFQGQPITVATDVYQLGLLLYELLTGRSAHADGGSPLAIQRRVLEVEPERPSRAVLESGDAVRTTLSRRLAGDLDAIVLKALRKEPGERYPSVEALRRDLEAYLESRPVAARRGTGVYRLRKYVHRHRVGVAASALLIVSLTGGLLGVGVQARIAAAERDRARSAESRAEAIRQFLLHELLQAPAPEESLGRTLTVAEVLDAASRSVAHAFSGMPETEADVRLTLARTYASLGRTNEAQRHGESARLLLENTYGPGSAAALRARSFLAEMTVAGGQYEEARAEIEEVLSLQRAVLPPGDPDVLTSQRVLGEALTLAAQFSEAERVLREALAVQVRDRPGDWRLGVELRGALVDALIGRQAPPETERLCREILEIQERHLGPEHPDVAATLDRLAGVLQRKLRWEDALEAARRALDLRRRVHGDEHPLTGAAWSRLGILYDRFGRTADCLDAVHRAHAIAEASLGPLHPDTLNALHGVGVALRKSGRLTEALPIFRRVVDGNREALGEEHAHTMRVTSHLQSVLVEAFRLDEARVLASDIRKVSERVMARPDADPEWTNNYAYWLLTVHPPDLRDPGRALELLERAASGTNRRAYHILLNLGLAQRATGRPDLAIDSLKEALALPEGVRSWTATQSAVDLLNEQGREDEVLAFLTALLERQRAARGDADFVVAKTERLIALQHQRLGDPEEAERWFRSCLATNRACWPEDHWEIARAKTELGGLLLDRGAIEEATPLIRDALRTLEADPPPGGGRLIEEARARVARLPKD